MNFRFWGQQWGNGFNMSKWRRSDLCESSNNYQWLNYYRWKYIIEWYLFTPWENWVAYCRCHFQQLVRAICIKLPYQDANIIMGPDLPMVPRHAEGSRCADSCPDTPIFLKTCLWLPGSAGDPWSPNALTDMLTAPDVLMGPGCVNSSKHADSPRCAKSPSTCWWPPDMLTVPRHADGPWTDQMPSRHANRWPNLPKVRQSMPTCRM